MYFQPEFLVSDLHAGDGGPRDNFAAMSGGNRLNEFNSFLDYVENVNGRLRIVGDLLELWQGNISKIFKFRLPLLNRLAEMGAVYQLGNHDVDLKYFVYGAVRINHPLFYNLLSTPQQIERNGRKILAIHGHIEDEFCCGENPDMGRVSAIYTGLKEDKNGGPLLRKYHYRTVEQDTLGRMFWPINLWNKLRRKPDHGLTMRRAVLQTFRNANVQALFYGHTHEPGQFAYHDQKYIKLPIYNLGTWAEEKNTFGRVNVDGSCGLFDWVNNSPVPNEDVLYV